MNLLKCYNGGSRTHKLTVVRQNCFHRFCNPHKGYRVNPLLRLRPFSRFRCLRPFSFTRHIFLVCLNNLLTFGLARVQARF